MPSYLITGANRGMGFGYVRNLSNDPANTVVGIVRDKAAAVRKASEELGNRPNVHFVEAQISNYNSLKSIVPQVSDITGGKLDYVISNAAYMGNEWSKSRSIGQLGEDPENWEAELAEHMAVNVSAVVYLFTLFLPLVRKGEAKKMVAISTGMADIELVSRFGVENGSIYTISKAASNAAVAKFDAQYRKEGILFLSISPGLVDTDANATPASPEELKAQESMVRAFVEYAPDFKGPISVDESNKAVLSVIENASIEKGSGGAFISHKGNKQWL
jgi:NAD(P)-dependent dehydrogenase (short-subunit alcohol dehydrogenase family)